MRRSESEKKREKRDKSVNTALIMLSVLSFFSALIDSVDFADSFLGLFMGAVGIWIVKSIFIGAIVCVTIYVIITLIGSGKKR